MLFFLSCIVVIEFDRESNPPMFVGEMQIDNSRSWFVWGYSWWLLRNVLHFFGSNVGRFALEWLFDLLLLDGNWSSLLSSGVLEFPSSILVLFAVTLLFLLYTLRSNLEALFWIDSSCFMRNDVWGSHADEQYSVDFVQHVFNVSGTLV